MNEELFKKIKQNDKKVALEEVVEMLNVKNFAAKYIRLQKH